MPKVSIIVPVCNAELYLSECLSSIEVQSLRDIEVLCIDDASSDSSLAICQFFADEDDRFHIIHFDKNKGAAAARNEGLRQAQGEYILFIDADDFYPHCHAVEDLYTAASQNDAHVAAGEICEVDQITGQVRSDYRDAGHLSLYNFDREGWMSYSQWQGDLGYTRFIYRRSFLKTHKLNFPELVRYEDPVFLVKTLLAADAFYALPEPVYYYRVHYKPQTLSKRAAEDAIDAHIDLLVCARENHLDKLEGWLVESLQYYMAFNVYHSLTYRIGEALAVPLRRAFACARRLLGQLSSQSLEA